MKSLDYLTIRSLKQRVRLGCTAEERGYPQLVNIDITFGLDFSKCIESSDVKDTINYMIVAQAVERITGECSWVLLERLTSDLALELLAQFSLAQSIEVEVTKFVINNATGVSARVQRFRS